MRRLPWAIVFHAFSVKTAPSLTVGLLPRPRPRVNAHPVVSVYNELAIMRTVSIKYLTFVILLLLVPSIITAAQTPAPTQPQETTNTSDAQLKAIRDQVQVKLDQFRVAKGFPGATIGFVLPDGRSASVSTGVSDLTTKRALVPDDLMLAGSIGKTFRRGHNPPACCRREG